MRPNVRLLRGSALPRPPVDPVDGGRHPGRHLLVVDDGSDLVPPLLASLRRAGYLPLVLQAEPHQRRAPTIVIPEGTISAVEGAIDRMREVAGGMGGILFLHLRPLDASQLDRALSTLYRAIAIARSIDRQCTGFLYFVTAQGGRFGLGGDDLVDMAAPALEALCHPLRLELPEVSFRSIDLDPRDGAERQAEQLRLEPGQPDQPPFTVYGWQGGERVVLGMEEIKAPSANGALSAQSVVLFAGGARGIGAVCGRQLASRTGCRIVFTGRTVLSAEAEALAILSSEQRQERMNRFIVEYQAGHPGSPPRAPRDAWRRLEQAAEVCQTLAAIRDAGGQAEYLAMDVRDAAAVEQVVLAVKERYGRLDAVVHVAGLGGVETDRLLSRKEWPAIEQLIETKARGAAHLLRAAERAGVSLFVGFGSVASRFGNAGQVDYSAANGLLSGVVRAHNARGNPPLARVLHWGAWDGVGMAVSGPTKAVLGEQGVEFIPPDAGAEAFMAQLELGTRGPAEVTISAQWPGLDELIAPAPSYSSGEATPQSESQQPGEQPLLGRVVELRAGESLLAEQRIAPRDIPFVDHHRYQGTAWLPTVMGLELGVEAASLVHRDLAPHAIRNVVLKKAVRFIRDEHILVRTQARAEGSQAGGDRAVHVTISAQAREQEWIFAEMDVLLTADRAGPGQDLEQDDRPLQIEPASERPGDTATLCRSDLYPSDALRFQQHGSTYQVLDELVVHPGEKVAHGYMTATPVGISTALPLPLIDGLLQAYGVALSREMGRWSGPPLAIEEIRWLPDAVTSLAELRFTMRWDASDPTRFPIWRAFDSRGELVLTMTGCTCGGTSLKDLGERVPAQPEPSKASPAPKEGVYPYLGAVLDEERGRRIRIAQILQPQEDALLRDHQFNRYVIVPAVYYMELAVEAAERLLGPNTARELRDFHFRQALTLVTEPKTMIVEAEVMGEGQVSVRFFSHRDDALTLHAEGTILLGASSPLDKLPPIPIEVDLVAARHDLYPHRFPNGPIFQVIDTMRLASDHTSHSILRLRERPRSGCRLPITLLDGAFQVDSATRSGFDRPSGLPRAFASLRWSPEVTRLDQVECFSSTGDSSTDNPGRLVFVDPAATIVLRLDGITLTPAFSSLWS